MLHKKLHYLVLQILIFSVCYTGCKSNTSNITDSGASGLKGETTDTSPSPPFASGAIGDLEWQLRINRAQCSHPGHPSTWCTNEDRARVIEQSGVEPTLLGWIRDPAVKSLFISYMTFSSSGITRALCEEATQRGLRIELFLHYTYVEPPESATGTYRDILNCAKTAPSLKVHGLGGKRWLHHAKIFLASTSEDPLSAPFGDHPIRFTSSSANLSASGVSLHYDNWLIFEAPARHYLARSNLCYFEGLSGMKRPDGGTDKALFAKIYNKCLATVSKMEQTPIEFFGVPSGQEGARPLAALLGLIAEARQSIRIAAHKITETGSARFPLVSTLVAAAQRGVSLTIVFDDDTILKKLALPGSELLNVSREEIAGYDKLLAAGAKISFIDTNEEIGALMHSKFAIIDEKVVWTGAGNFSSSSLNGDNSEQFYLIREPAIVAAYVRAQQELVDWALPAEQFHKQLPVVSPTTPVDETEAAASGE